jgi:hypothetical protein
LVMRFNRTGIYSGAMPTSRLPTLCGPPPHGGAVGGIYRGLSGVLRAGSCRNRRKGVGEKSARPTFRRSRVRLPIFGFTICGTTRLPSLAKVVQRTKRLWRSPGTYRERCSSATAIREESQKEPRSKRSPGRVTTHLRHSLAKTMRGSVRKLLKTWWTRGDSNPRPPRCERGKI